MLKTLPAKARLGGTPTRSSVDLDFGRTEAGLPAAVSVPATSTRPREAAGLLDPFSFFLPICDNRNANRNECSIARSKHWAQHELIGARHSAAAPMPGGRSHVGGGCAGECLQTVGGRICESEVVFDHAHTALPVGSHSLGTPSTSGECSRSLGWEDLPACFDDRSVKQ